MAKIPETFNFGTLSQLDHDELLRYIQDMYQLLARAINDKPDIVIRDPQSDGQTTDVKLNVGDININQTTNNVEMLTNFTDSTTVVWTTIS